MVRRGTGLGTPTCKGNIEADSSQPPVIPVRRLLRATLDGVDNSQHKPEGSKCPSGQEKQASAFVRNVDVPIVRLKAVHNVHRGKKRASDNHERAFGASAKYCTNAKRNSKGDHCHDDSDIVEDDHVRSSA